LRRKLDFKKQNINIGDLLIGKKNVSGKKRPKNFRRATERKKCLE
jgi:hypothetical protein